jgi:hypothetical protein
MVTHHADTSQDVTRDVAQYLRFREQFAIDPPALASVDDAEHAATVLRRSVSGGGGAGQDVVDVHDGARWVDSYVYDHRGAHVLGPDGAPLTRRVMVGGAPLLPAATGLGVRDGRTFRLEVSIGSLTVRAFDAARAERTDERSTRAARSRADSLVQYIDASGAINDPQGAPSRSVYEWSAKSRANMFRAIAQLDVADWFSGPAPEGATMGMVTVTLPGPWEMVAPNGRAYKALMRSLVQAFRRAGVDHRHLWKLEFQGRGAPHTHMLMRVPVHVMTDGGYGKALGYEVPVVFDDWLRVTWTGICLRAVLKRDDLSAEDKAEYETVHYPRALRSGLGREGATSVDFDQRKMSDPRRIATYFLGHSVSHAGGKEYQHVVPESWETPGDGPGRFWGYVGLKRVSVPVDVTEADYYAVRRVLRHIARARAWKQQEAAARYGKTVKRWGLRSLGARGGITGGSVIVNDGVALALDVARFLDSRRVSPAPVEPRARLVVKSVSHRAAMGGRWHTVADEDGTARAYFVEWE